MRFNFIHKAGFIIFSMILCFAVRAYAEPQQILHVKPADSVGPGIQNVPVAPFGEVLFYLHTGIGPFSPASRASGLESRIRDLAGINFFNTDSLRLMEYEGTYNIMFGEMIVTTISNGDSIAEKSSKESIAKKRLARIVYAVDKYRELNSRKAILKSILFSGLVLVILLLLFIFIHRLFRFIVKKINIWIGPGRKAFTIFNYQFLNRDRQIKLFVFISKITRLILFILLFIVALFIMFYLLPWTKPFTMEVLGYLLYPLKKVGNAFLNYIPNFLIIVVFIIISIYVNRFFRFMKREIEQEALKIPGFYPEWALPTFNIIRIIVWAFTIIVIWPYIPGSDSTIFQGITVFFGLVFSLTSASLLSNIMAGFSLTYTRAFKIGDRVKIGDVVGDIIEKSMLVTKVITIKNEEVTIPNSKIMSSEVTNYSTAAPVQGVILHTTVTIGYDAPWRKVHDLLISAALATDGILSEPKPFVLQTSLDDSYVSYQVNAYSQKPNDMVNIYSRLHQNIQDKFNEAGVEIMSPHFKAIRDGNTITIPEEQRGEGYEALGFRINSGG